ncbi:unnamed protein product [Gongylonema pulchrum]|uniref:glucuronosyltransferase n=1 Tax=Gongylonema pulchrum TaxID=637853 RepID=A0A3P6RTK0_9BILA|nr:unnamed protein product [Gongylonema pulchrum]
MLSAEILDHPKLRAFVSHCGLNSLTESVIAGVPVICIPLFGDQMRNARTGQKRNIAMILDKQDLTADDLASALRTIIYQDR